MKKDYMKNEIAVTLALTHMFYNNTFDKKNAIILLREIMERLDMELPDVNDFDKVAYVVHFLTEIAKGADGILGTSDDIIPAQTLADIQKMTETSVLEDILHLCKDVINKKKPGVTKCSLLCLKLF